MSNSTKGKSADLEARQLAFDCYCECGGNVEATLRKLKEHEYSLSKPSLYDWIEKFNFKERQAAADLKRQAARDASLTTEETLLAPLLAQKGKYERHFDSLGAKVDNQALFAYQGLVKAIIDIQARTKAYRHDISIEAVGELVRYLLQEEDTEGMAVVERHLDGFAAHLQDKYGK